MKMHCLLLFLYLNLSLTAQFQWDWQVMEPMPEAISNNAVSEAHLGGEVFVYSFSGIDTTKTNEGISLHSFKYNVQQDSWSTIPGLPDTLGKIAAAASTVGDMIYIIGGYHVFDGPPYELSSDKVHRFDPATDTYSSDGAPCPYPIDDQVQVVWRDSLIYVVTGWSDTENVQHVQIYDPANDAWQLGTPVPNGSQYEAFGASGAVIGDTIYYFGGAAGFSFNSSNRLRKGVIDPEDPTQITWSIADQSPTQNAYRSAALAHDEVLYWIGGSHTTYNYDGIAYNGSGGVPPLYRIMAYEPSLQLWHDMSWQPYGVMDLRGIASIGDGDYIICGGMVSGQEVTDQVYRITYGGPSGLREEREQVLHAYPNPCGITRDLIIINPRPHSVSVRVVDIRGAEIGHVDLIPGEHAYSPGVLGVTDSGVYQLIGAGFSSTPIVISGYPE